MRYYKIAAALSCTASFLWLMHTISKNFVIDPDFQSFLAKKDGSISDPSLWAMTIRVHIVLALIALLTGPIGILKRFRRHSITLHRWNGRIYFTTILLNFLPSLYAAYFASGGVWSTIGFVILDTIWLLSTIAGGRSIRKNNVRKHREWMTRSYFLSFANLTIYVVVAITHSGIGLPYGLSYTFAVWVCWVLNLSLAELVIRRKVLWG